MVLGGCFLVPDTFEGRYSLLSIDGEALPVIFSNDGDRVVEALSGFLDARADNSFLFSVTVRIQEGDDAPYVVPIESGGFWSQTGDGLTLLVPGAEALTTDYDGSEVSFTDSGRTYVLGR